MNDRDHPADPSDPFGSAVPDAFEVDAGDAARMPLISAAGAGYMWALDEIDGHGTAHMKVEVGLPDRSLADGLPTNAAAPLELVVAGLQPGTSRWRARLIRPWMPDTPLVDQQVTITVREPHDRAHEEPDREESDREESAHEEPAEDAPLTEPATDPRDA